jgi:hypothetical protein
MKGPSHLEREETCIQLCFFTASRRRSMTAGVFLPCSQDYLQISEAAGGSEVGASAQELHAKQMLQRRRRISFPDIGARQSGARMNAVS